MANLRQGFSVGASTALSSSYPASGIALTDVSGTDSISEVVPDQCQFGWLHGQIDTIADSAASVTWFLAADSGGDVPLTEALTETIATGITTATDGAVVSLLERVYRRAGSGVAGTIYLFAKTNTGTCNIVPRLYWVHDA